MNAHTGVNDFRRASSSITVPNTLPIPNGILGLIGNTPLVRFQRYLGKVDIDLVIKLEAMNPGGSAKDRPASHIISRALSRGDIRTGDTIIESSSGNMGVGLAQVCNAFGLRFICVADTNAQKQNLDIIRALGGEIQLVAQPLNSDFLAARIERVEELLREIPHSFQPNQYANLDNPAAHTEGTIREIVNELGHEFDALFVATSSTGTARGCRDLLEALNHPAEIYAVDAQGSTLFGGKSGPRYIPGMGAGRIPPLAEGQTFDHVVRINDARCVAGCRRAARYESVLIGGSAGAVLEAVRKHATSLVGKRVVAILHDSGTRYLSTIFDDDWVQARLGKSPQEIADMIEDVDA